MNYTETEESSVTRGNTHGSCSFEARRGDFAYFFCVTLGYDTRTARSYRNQAALAFESLQGKTLDRWRLGALVGKGACAYVYEATDVRGEAGGPFVAKVVPVPQGLPPRINRAGRKRKLTAQERDVNMISHEYTLYQGWLQRHGGVVKVCV